MKFLGYATAFFLIVFCQSAVAEEYESRYSVDITGDSLKEVITYKLKKKGDKYDGTLKIATKDYNVLWFHEFEMSHDDLFNDLLMNEGNISLEHWVKHFFDGSLVYGAKYEKRKITEDEINMDFLEFYSKKLKHTKEELKKLILDQKINSIFYYRASWREELVMLVYIPKLKKMLHYSGGEY